MITVAVVIPWAASVVAIAVSAALVPAVVVTVMPAVLDMVMVVVMHHLAMSLPCPGWAAMGVLGGHDDRHIHHLLAPVRAPRRRMHHHGRWRHHHRRATAVNAPWHIRHHGADATMAVHRHVKVYRPVQIAGLREPGGTDRKGPHQPGTGRRKDRIDTHEVCSFPLFNAGQHACADAPV
jgi:hypothetical protein